MIGYKGQNQSSSSSFINQMDANAALHQSSQKSDLNKISKMEAKQQEAIRLQQQRLMMQNDSFAMESPEMNNNRRLNSKAGVTLAPLNAPQPVGRQSMMSMNKEIENINGKDSHPILRVQNYKKPTLDKIAAAGGGAKNNGFSVNMGEQMINNNGIQMTFQATINIDQNQNMKNIMNSKKQMGRKRDTT
jgi:hypothetical protein